MMSKDAYDALDSYLKTFHTVQGIELKILSEERVNERMECTWGRGEHYFVY